MKLPLIVSNHTILTAINDKIIGYCPITGINIIERIFYEPYFSGMSEAVRDLIATASRGRYVYIYVYVSYDAVSYHYLRHPGDVIVAYVYTACTGRDERMDC